MKINLTERKGEIVGSIKLSADPAFNLEALVTVIEALAQQHNVAPDAVVRDLYSLVCGRVTTSSTPATKP